MKDEDDDVNLAFMLGLILGAIILGMCVVVVTSFRASGNQVAARACHQQGYATGRFDTKTYSVVCWSETMLEKGR